MVTILQQQNKNDQIYNDNSQIYGQKNDKNDIYIIDVSQNVMKTNKSVMVFNYIHIKHMLYLTHHKTW